MHRLLPTLTLAFLTIFWSSNSYGQGRNKAEQAVKDYLTSRHDNYRPGSFGEFFEQTSPEEVEEKIGIDGQVKYSLVHTYVADNHKVQDEYFHLDKSMKVLGQLSSQQMMDITMGLLFKSEKVKSVLNSMGADTTNIQME